MWLAVTDTHKQLQGRAIMFGNSLLHTPAAAHTSPADTAQPQTQGRRHEAAQQHTHTTSVQGVDVNLLGPCTQTCASSQSLPGAHARPPALHRNPFEPPSKRTCHATCGIQEAQHFCASDLCIAVLYSPQASGLLAPIACSEHHAASALGTNKQPHHVFHWAGTAGSTHCPAYILGTHVCARCQQHVAGDSAAWTKAWVAPCFRHLQACVAAHDTA